MMNPIAASFALLSTKALLALNFEGHVQAVLEQRPADADRVQEAALIAQDLVLHYEQAVVLGTTAEYEEHSKIWHFSSILDAADTKCAADIQLFSCVKDLICQGKIVHNLDTRRMDCR